MRGHESTPPFHSGPADCDGTVLLMPVTTGAPCAPDAPPAGARGSTRADGRRLLRADGGHSFEVRIMTAAAVLFPPEVFIDQLLVTIRDSSFRLPGSTLPHHQHARQAAALARRAGCSDAMVAAALVSGIGDVVARGWARHPRAVCTDVDPGRAALAHLGTHLPDSVTGPVALLGVARAHLAPTTAAAGGSTRTDHGRRRLETEPHGASALELGRIHREAGRRVMIAPTLDVYRELLHGLCHSSLAHEPSLTPA